MDGMTLNSQKWKYDHFWKKKRALKDSLNGLFDSFQENMPERNSPKSIKQCIENKICSLSKRLTKFEIRYL